MIDVNGLDMIGATDYDEQITASAKCTCCVIVVKQSKSPEVAVSQDKNPIPLGRGRVFGFLNEPEIFG